MPIFRIAVPVSGFQMHEIDRETESEAFEGILLGLSNTMVVPDNADVDLDTNNWVVESKILTSKQYVEKEGSHCPYCLSMDITTPRPGTSGTEIYVECRCETCKATWTDEYALAGYGELVVPSKD